MGYSLGISRRLLHLCHGEQYCIPLIWHTSALAQRQPMQWRRVMNRMWFERVVISVYAVYAVPCIMLRCSVLDLP